MSTTQANGHAIRVIRERSELTINQLVQLIAAEGVDIHPDYLRNIELGHKQPSQRVLGGIARALKCPKIALLGPSREPDATRPARRVA